MCWDVWDLMWVKGSGLGGCVNVWIFLCVCALKCVDLVDVYRCEFYGCVKRWIFLCYIVWI